MPVPEQAYDSVSWAQAQPSKYIQQTKVIATIVSIGQKWTKVTPRDKKKDVKWVRTLNLSGATNFNLAFYLEKERIPTLNGKQNKWSGNNIVNNE